MARKCGTNLTHPTFGYSRMDRNDFIYVHVKGYAEPCWSAETRNGEAAPGTVVMFDAYDRPEDILNCVSDCRNTGTLWVAPSGNSAGVKLSIPVNSLAFTPDGIITQYLKLPAGDFNVQMIISDIDDPNQNDAYVYSMTMQSDGNKVLLPMFELDNVAAATQIGAGWTPSVKGVTVTFVVTAIAPTTLNTNVGFSTLNIFESRASLVQGGTVGLTCIESFADDLSLDLGDATCISSGYDQDSVTVEKTITATLATSNFWLLNPLETKSDDVESWMPAITTITVQPHVVDGKNYGIIHISDMYQEACGWVVISSGKECDEDVFESIAASHAIDLNLYEFILNSTEGYILVNEEYVGEELLITYPKTTVAEVHDITDANLLEFEAEITIPIRRTDNKQERIEFSRILVTSVNRTYSSTDNTTIEIGFTASRDRNNRFGRRVTTRGGAA